MTGEVGGEEGDVDGRRFMRPNVADTLIFREAGKEIEGICPSRESPEE
jgi:hypothetical protein